MSYKKVTSSSFTEPSFYTKPLSSDELAQRCLDLVLERVRSHAICEPNRDQNRV